MTNLVDNCELNQNVVDAIEGVLRAIGDPTPAEAWTVSQIENGLATAASRLREARRSVTTTIAHEKDLEAAANWTERERRLLGDLARELDLSPCAPVDEVLDAAFRYVSDADAGGERGLEWTKSELGSLGDLRRELELSDSVSARDVLEAAIHYVSDAEQDFVHRWTERERDLLVALRAEIEGLSEQASVSDVLIEAAGTLSLLRGQNKQLAQRVAHLDDEVTGLREVLEASSVHTDPDDGLFWTEPLLKALRALRAELDLPHAECPTVEVLRQALGFIRASRPVALGDVIPGWRAQGLGVGAVVVIADLPDALALTHLSQAGWQPAAPAHEADYLVLRLPEARRSESEE